MVVAWLDFYETKESQKLLWQPLQNNKTPVERDCCKLPYRSQLHTSKIRRFRPRKESIHFTAKGLCCVQSGHILPIYQSKIVISWILWNFTYQCIRGHTWVYFMFWIYKEIRKIWSDIFSQSHFFDHFCSSFTTNIPNQIANWN